MNSNILGLLFMIDGLAYVLWYAWVAHRNKIETSANTDKITLTVIFSLFVGLIKYTMLCIGYTYCDGHIQLFTFIQDGSILVIATCVGMKLHEDIKPPHR